MKSYCFALKISTNEVLYIELKCYQTQWLVCFVTDGIATIILLEVRKNIIGQIMLLPKPIKSVWHVRKPVFFKFN